jgi:predicted RNA-binding Zn-ribbon protein involved in translation (DUF1610 family)
MSRRIKSKRLLFCLAAGLLAASVIFVLRTRESLIDYRSTGGWTLRVYVPQESTVVEFFASWPVGPAIADEHPDQEPPPGEPVVETFEACGVRFSHGQAPAVPWVIRHLVRRNGTLTAADRGLWARPHRYALMQMPFLAFAVAVALLVLLPLLPRWWRRFRRRLRADANATCTNCGYDLRSTPQRCPECGEIAGEHSNGQRQRGQHRPHPETRAE